MLKTRCVSFQCCQRVIVSQGLPLCRSYHGSYHQPTFDLVQIGALLRLQRLVLAVERLLLHPDDPAVAVGQLAAGAAAAAAAQRVLPDDSSRGHSILLHALVVLPVRQRLLVLLLLLMLLLLLLLRLVQVCAGLT